MNYAASAAAYPARKTCMPILEHDLTVKVHCGLPSLVGEMLAAPGAVLSGHFELLSGLHADRFLAFSRIAGDEQMLGDIADWLLPGIGPTLPDAIAAPKTAGVALGWMLSRRLGIPFHLATVDEGGRADAMLGAPDLGGRRVLLVNDVVTTGDGFEALATAAKDAGAEIAGAAWFVSRSDGTDIEARLDTPGFSIATMVMPAWPAAGCALCGAHEPTRLGLDLN